MSTSYLNLYMIYGGTNWGGIAHPGVYTSYDYADISSVLLIWEELHSATLRRELRRHSIMNYDGNWRGCAVLSVDQVTMIRHMTKVKVTVPKSGGILIVGFLSNAPHVVGVSNFTDVPFTLVKGKLEDAELPITQFDIIISEWMGYFLLYESMLDTVLLARDKYLKPDGQMFPDTARMYFAAIEDQDYKEEKINFWDNVYGFDYSCIKDIALREPLVDTVELKSVVTDPYMFKHVNLLTAKKEDLTFTAPFTLTATRNDYIHAFLAWFDITFDCTHKKIQFSTGPHAQYTHWKQTVFYTPSTITISEGERINGTLTCAPNARNNRDLDITVEYTAGGETTKVEYKMS
ncbi:protein arginine n-methyltransferase, partial [Butyriboletus roseoflavus]